MEISYIYFMFQQNIMLGDSWLKIGTAPKTSSNRNYFSHLKKIYADKINIYYYLLCIHSTGPRWFRTIVFLNEITLLGIEP